MGAGIKHKRTQTQLGDKRGSDCHVYRHIPREKQTELVWTRERERRARAHTTSAQHDGTMGEAERKTTVMNGGHHRGT